MDERENDLELLSRYQLPWWANAWALVVDEKIRTFSGVRVLSVTFHPTETIATVLRPTDVLLFGWRKEGEVWINDHDWFLNGFTLMKGTCSVEGIYGFGIDFALARALHRNRRRQ